MHERIESCHFSPPHNYRGRFITERCHLWPDMLTNLHVRLWELVAKISADTLSFRNSFFTISTPVVIPNQDATSIYSEFHA